MSRVYKHCVVGHGLTGTAACKYLAALGEDVILVGPSEGSGAHGACYDEGRVYRIVDAMESWARLAEKSIDQYASIAEHSGIDFYNESGLLVFGAEDGFIKETREMAAKMGTPIAEFSPEELAKKFPWLRAPPPTKTALYQQRQAGHLSPRKLTEAQLRLARASGAEYLDRTVERVARPSQGEPFTVHMAGGHTVQAENVLVAAGVHSSVLPLLPEEVVVTLTCAQALLAELSPEDAMKLADMPSMLYEGEREEDCYYLLPPIQYPDGKWLLKIGPSTAYAPPLRTVEEVDAWFRRGTLDRDFEEAALVMLKSMFPTITVGSFRPLLCVTDCTVTQNMYIDRLQDGWGVCTGGNGWAAKSSDAIGHLAAQMMALPEHWSPDPQLPRSWFRAVTPSRLTPSPQLDTAVARVEAMGLVEPARCVEALQVASSLLASSPKLAWAYVPPAALADRLREALAMVWGSPPTVICVRGGAPPAIAPGHPFLALAVGPLFAIVLLAS